MSSICSSAIPVEINPELMQDNWAWVDQRLEELYHGYGLTYENYDDYIDACLLVEMSSWVDNEQENQYSNEFKDCYPCPAPICWVLYKNIDSQHCLEEEQRSRAESDISDHSDKVKRVLKRLDCQSPLPTRMCQNDYSDLYAIADESESMNSLEANFGFDECSSSVNDSEISSVRDWFVEDDDYDSF